jgi:MoaA/NifB/PqqE/SkfB family radical SAM enzyme
MEIYARKKRDFNYLQILGTYTDKVLTGPQNVELEVNTHCNMNCIFCWFHSPLCKSEPNFWELQFEKFKEIILDLKAMGTHSLFLTGQGEPCLHPDLQKMIRFAKENGFYITLTTNLAFNSLLVLKNLRLVDRLEINLSTVQKEKYKEIYCPRSKNYFDLVMKNLKELKNYMKSKIIFVYVVNKLNISILDEMVKFVIENGFHCIKFHLLNYGNSFGEKDKRDELHLTNEEKYKFLRHIQLIKKEIPTLVEDDLLYLDKGIKRCYMGWFSATIGCYGDVWIGCGNKNLPQAGNICRESFKNIWFSRKTQEIRERFKYQLKFQKNHCPLSLLNLKIEKQIQHLSTKNI